jgi:hypothetical protein
MKFVCSFVCCMYITNKSLELWIGNLVWRLIINIPTISVFNIFIRQQLETRQGCKDEVMYDILIIDKICT